MDALQLRDNAKYELMQIKNIETGIDYLNKVKGIEAWAKAEKKDAELQNLIAEQKLRTQRILGGLIKEGQERGEIATSKFHGKAAQGSLIKEGNKTPKKLQDVGLTAHQSSNFQKIASLPDEVFEKEISEAKQESEKRIELTTSRVLKAAKEYDAEKKKQDAKISERDRDIIDRLKNGLTVVVNQRTDLAAIRYAEENNKYVRCDRFSDWGNPFEMGKDGTRDDVCEYYEKHYLPYKKSLLNKLSTLKGKALGCWCSPEKCHCDSLIKLIEDEEI